MKIAVVGTGYVDLSFAVLVAQNHDVVVLDVVQEKIDLLKQKNYLYTMLKYNNF